MSVIVECSRRILRPVGALLRRRCSLARAWVPRIRWRARVVRGAPAPVARGARARCEHWRAPGAPARERCARNRARGRIHPSIGSTNFNVKFLDPVEGRGLRADAQRVRGGRGARPRDARRPCRGRRARRRRAAHAANLTPLLDSLPERFDTVFGERELKLSGGEKQRSRSRGPCSRTRRGPGTRRGGARRAPRPHAPRRQVRGALDRPGGAERRTGGRRGEACGGPLRAAAAAGARGE